MPARQIISLIVSSQPSRWCLLYSSRRANRNPSLSSSWRKMTIKSFAKTHRGHHLCQTECLKRHQQPLRVKETIFSLLKWCHRSILRKAKIYHTETYKMLLRIWWCNSSRLRKDSPINFPPIRIISWTITKQHNSSNKDNNIWGSSTFRTTAAFPCFKLSNIRTIAWRNKLLFNCCLQVLINCCLQAIPTFKERHSNHLSSAHHPWPVYKISSKISIPNSSLRRATQSTKYNISRVLKFYSRHSLSKISPHTSLRHLLTTTIFKTWINIIFNIACGKTNRTMLRIHLFSLNSSACYSIKTGKWTNLIILSSSSTIDAILVKDSHINLNIIRLTTTT